MSKYLKKVFSALDKASKNNPELFNYAIPDTWLSFDYKGQHIKVHDGNVLVNPYHFYKTLIKEVFLEKEPASQALFL